LLVVMLTARERKRYVLMEVDAGVASELPLVYVSKSKKLPLVCLGNLTKLPLVCVDEFAKLP
jgi:hypothetical protein